MQRIVTATRRMVTTSARRTSSSTMQSSSGGGARRTHSYARSSSGAAATSSASRLVMMATVAVAGAATATLLMQSTAVAKAAPRDLESQEEDTFVRDIKNDDELRRLLQSGKDVLLEVYDEECINCALLSGILRQTSFAVNEVPGIVIAKVNDKIPAVRSLLSDEEMEIRPFIALHLTSGQRIVYQHDARGVKEFLQFLHEHGRSKFNMKQAIATAARFEASTQRILHRTVAEGLPKEQKNDVTLRLHMGAPCGDQLEALYTALALAPYRDDLMPLARAKVAMAECESSRVPQRIEYWKRINDVAQKELASMPPLLLKSSSVSTDTAVAQEIVAAHASSPASTSSPAAATAAATATKDSNTSDDNAAVHQLKFWTQVANTAEKELQSATAARDKSSTSSSSTSDATPVVPTNLKPKIK